LLLVGVVGFFGAQMLGIDLLQLTTGAGAPTQLSPVSAEDQELADFVAVVLADTEETWRKIFAAAGSRYEEPVLVLFSQRVRASGQGKSAAEVNNLSVRQAASAIGDDRLQKRGGGEVVPDSFTHGTSAQRVAWFRRGFDSGDVSQCDTFAAGI